MVPLSEFNEELRGLGRGVTALCAQQVLLPSGPERGLAVVVDGDLILDVCPVAELEEKHPSVEVIDLGNKLLMPGFVDAHHHVTQTFGKSLVFGEPSEIFQRVWVPMEQALTSEEISLATKLAAWESLRGGFTTVADAGTRSALDVGQLAHTTSQVGVRMVLGVICNDVIQGEQVRDLADVKAGAEAHLSRWENDSLVHPSLAVSIPEVASDEALVSLTGLAREAGVTFQTHLNEHLVAVERSLVATGHRPLERLHALGALGPELLAAHATLLTPSEVLLLKDADAAVSYNPVASSWKGNAVAPALLMHELGVRLGLGTDGTRSDAFRLLDAAETAQRFAHTMSVGDSSTGGGWPWLEQGLRGGADAVRLSGKVGELRVGAYADLLIVDVDTPEFTPSWDLPWELVRFGNRDQIDAVIVGGKLRLVDGWPVDWDGQELLQEIRQIATRAVANSPIQTIDPTSMDHRARWHA